MPAATAWCRRLVAAALSVGLGRCPCVDGAPRFQPLPPSLTFDEPFTERAVLWEDAAVLFSTLVPRTFTELWWSLAWPGLVSYWDCNPRLQELYLVMRGPCYLDQTLVVTDFEGRHLRELPVPDECIRGIALSPDGSLLLVERWYEPPVELPLDAANTRLYGGFLLLDVASGEPTDGPHRGRAASWRPGGRTIAYVWSGDVLLYDLARGESRTLVSLVPDTFPLSRALAWSPDEMRLAVAGVVEMNERQGRPVLLIDLAQREFLLLPEPAVELLWLPGPRPFGG